MAEKALGYTERHTATGGPVVDAPKGFRQTWGSANSWHPTVVNLLVLVVLEVLIYGLLRWSFRSFHGG